MRTYFLFFLILNVFVILGCKDSTRTALKSIKYVRETSEGIKRIREYQCDGYWNNVVPPKILTNSCKLHRLKEYSSKGYLEKDLQWTGGDFPNPPNIIELIKYNDLNQVVEELYKQTGTIEHESKTIYSYNSEGFQIEKIIIKNDVIDFRVETKYDEYNCPIELTYYGKENQILQHLTQKYDNKNRIIEKETFEGDKLKYREVYKYGNGEDYIKYKRFDSEGKLIKDDDRNEVSKSSNFNFLYTNELPEKGYKDVEYYSNGKVKTWHYKNQNGEDIHQVYDENQRIIERKISSNGEWKDTFTWKYREDGVVLEESESTSRYLGISYFKKTTYYKYDLKNNWIEKVTLDTEGNAIELIMREIEYIEV